MPASRRLLVLSLALGVTAGFLASYTPGADAARNSSGTHSLPSGNPVVTGTTITSTWANALTNDISTELTSSLDRSGRGAMLAPLQCYAGSASLPGITFASDTDTGLYRAGSADVRMQVDATYVQKWSPTNVAVTTQLQVLDGGTFAIASTNGNAVSATGSGTGAGALLAGGATGNGVTASGGATSGFGAYGAGGGTSGIGVYGIGGAPNGIGTSGQGTGTGLGGYFVGGTTGDGLSAVGGGSSKTGLVGTGGAGGAGVIGVAGTAASGGTRQTAVAAQQGDLLFTTVTNPTSTTSIANSLTAANVVKLWARVDTDGAGNATVQSGFNVASVGITAGDLVVTVAADFAAATYACVVSGGNAGGGIGSSTYRVHTYAVGSFQIERADAADGTEEGFASNADKINIICMGLQ